MRVEERFAQGDLGAFEELFRAYQPDVYRWVARIVRDHGIAENLTVEAFLRMYRAHARFDPNGNFGGWARRIATNLALDHLRKSRREEPLTIDPEDSRASARAGNDAAERREIRDAVARAMSELPPKLRVVAMLALVEDVPYREIGDALGISEGAARVRGFRASRLLREKLKVLGAAL
jgi:RNA polymerase sigma-70 factor (ECF subfamily)